MPFKNELSKDLSLEQFRRFRDFIDGAAGIYLEDAKMDSLRISLVARATRFNLKTLEDYFTILTGDPAEFKELLNIITVNETSFFRFPQQFDALRNRVLPEILEGKLATNRNVRVWSAGCSTGEEPYTIGMSLLDSGVEGLGWHAHVLGTDVSAQALAKAREALYPKKAAAALDPDLVKRYFERDGDKLRVAKNVRRLVDLQYHNLIKEPYPIEMMAGWDVIFCRNVTIYFKLESTRRVVHNFYESLNEGGYLFVGHSETLTSVSSEFEAVETGGVFLYRKPRERKAFPSALPATGSRRGPRSERHEGAEWKDAAATAASEPPRIAALIEEARELFAERHPEKVLALVDEILTAEPASAEAHVLAAHAYAEMEDFDAALAACNRALALNPLLPVARYILGLIRQRQGDMAGAVSEFKKTIYIDTDFALAHLNLGTIYKTRGDWELAAREYENTIRSLNKNPNGAWREFLGGFQSDLLLKTCERSLAECRKAMGIA